MAKGMVWKDIAFSVEVEDSAKAVKQEPSPESDDLPPEMVAKSLFEGTVCVRSDPKRLDDKKEPMNIVMIKRTGALGDWNSRTAWNKVANKILDGVANLMAPPDLAAMAPAKEVAPPKTKPTAAAAATGATAAVQVVLKNVPGIGCCSTD